MERLAGSKLYLRPCPCHWSLEHLQARSCAKLHSMVRCIFIRWNVFMQAHLGTRVYVDAACCCDCGQHHPAKCYEHLQNQRERQLYMNRVRDALLAFCWCCQHS